MNLQFESEDWIKLPLQTFLTSRGIDFVDITEARVLIKSSPKDLDTSALADRTIGNGGVVIDEAGNSLAFQFAPTDWGVGKMVIDGQYKICVGFLVAGRSKYLEVSLKDSSLTITQDSIRS